MRSDYRYGPDDHTLWPQPYLANYPYLGAIPRKPEDPDDPLSIMWWDPTRDDFEPWEAGVLEGLGRLSTSKFKELEKMMHDIQDRITECRKEPFVTTNANTLLRYLDRAMNHACFRLYALRSAFGQMKFGVTEFQRYYLEIRGLLDYLEVYSPRMTGEQPAATTVAHCIGVFTNVPQVAQFFHRAGLPVWFIQPWSGGPFPHNVLDVVSPLDPANSLCVSQHAIPFPVIFRGHMNVTEKHDAIHCYSRMWLAFKDPFQDNELLKDLQPTTNVARGASCTFILFHCSTLF